MSYTVKIDKDLDNIGEGGGGNGLPIVPSAHATTGTVNLTFDANKDYPAVSQTGDLIFTYANSGNIEGAQIVLTIDGNSVNSITLSGVKFVVGNGVITNNTKRNRIFIMYTNGEFVYNVITSTIPDTIPPVLVSAIINNAAPTLILLTYNKSLTTSPLPATTDFSLNLSKTVNSVAISGSVVTLTVNSAYTVGQLPTVSYTAGVNPIMDLFGNLAANLVNQAITNNVGLPFVADNFNSPDILDLVGRNTPTGGLPWYKIGSGTGTIGIVSNVAKNTGTTILLDNFYLVDAGIRNVDYSITIATAGSPTLNDSAIMFCVQNTSNFLRVRNDCSILQVSGGSPSTIFSTTNMWVSGDVIRIVITATTITLYKNGVQLYTGTAGAAVTGTSFGFYAYRDNSVAFDNYQLVN